jgi:hypothetical protein
VNGAWALEQAEALSAPEAPLIQAWNVICIPEVTIRLSYLKTALDGLELPDVSYLPARPASTVLSYKVR